MDLDMFKILVENPDTVAAFTDKTEFEFIYEEDGKLYGKPQANALAGLLNAYFRYHSLLRPEKYEFKKVSITVMRAFVSVVLEVGMRGDENTMAELFARARVHAFVYERGRVKAQGKASRIQKRATKARNIREASHISY